MSSSLKSRRHLQLESAKQQSNLVNDAFEKLPVSANIHPAYVKYNKELGHRKVACESKYIPPTYTPTPPPTPNKNQTPRVKTYRAGTKLRNHKKRNNKTKKRR